MSSYTYAQCKALLVVWFFDELLLEGREIPHAPSHFINPMTGREITERSSTTEWGKKLTAEFVQYLYATGDTGGTVWSEPALKQYESYRQTKVKI